MVCFPEYETLMVKVHDLIRVREPDGWQFRKGVYRKLRLAAAVVVDRLENAGFAVARHEAPAGMVALVGTLIGSRRS
jgi:predicted RNA binding protein YcfA (HicA-like mRNA interferase family)